MLASGGNSLHFVQLGAIIQLEMAFEKKQMFTVTYLQYRGKSGYTLLATLAQNKVLGLSGPCPEGVRLRRFGAL